MAETSTTAERGAADHPLPPGPDGLPVVGNTLALMRDPMAFVDRAADYGDVVGYRAAGQRFTLLLHPEYVERVLVEDHDRFRRWSGEEWGSAFGEYGQEGLLLTEGEQWREQRRLIQNAFTPDRIDSYAEGMVAETGAAVDRWDAGQRVDLVEAASALTLRILARTLFDLDVEGRGEPIRRAARLLNARADVTNPSALLPDWVPTRTNRRFRAAMADLESVLDDVVAERRGAGDRDDLLSLLLNAGDEGEGLSEREVRDQLITFLFAGHETTGLALAYALRALARNPDAARRLRAELDDVTGGDPPGLADLLALEYTDAVVTETLRLYPPAYAVFREATGETVLGGYRVPEGSKLTLSVFRIHRDGRFYDDPGTFRPDRWDGDLREENPDYAYFPFGGGPRHCIGMRMARMELKLAVPTVLSAVDLDPVGPDDLSFAPRLTLRPADPIRVRVHPRDDAA